MSNSPRSTTDPIPPDIAEYMLAAVQELSKEQGVEFTTPLIAQQWVGANMIEIANRAQANMKSFVWKVLCKDKIKQDVMDSMGHEVYERIKAANPNPPRQFTEKYKEYARSQGHTPEEQMELQTNHTGFLVWCAERRHDLH